MKKLKNNRDMSKELLRTYITKSHVELACILIIIAAIALLFLSALFN